MALIETSPRTLPLSTQVAHRTITWANDALARVRRWREVRRTVRILSALDSEQLDDLGLTRGDIERFARRGHF